MDKITRANRRLASPLCVVFGRTLRTEHKKPSAWAVPCNGPTKPAKLIKFRDITISWIYLYCFSYFYFGRADWASPLQTRYRTCGPGRRGPFILSTQCSAEHFPQPRSPGPTNEQTQKNNRHRKEAEYYGKGQHSHLGRAFTKSRLYLIAVTNYHERWIATICSLEAT